MEKHWASMMIGLMAACRLSVEGLKVSDGGTTGASTKKVMPTSQIDLQMSRKSDQGLTFGHHHVGLHGIEPAVAQVVLGRSEKNCSYSVNISTAISIAPLAASSNRIIRHSRSAERIFKKRGGLDG